MLGGIDIPLTSVAEDDPLESLTQTDMSEVVLLHMDSEVTSANFFSCSSGIPTETGTLYISPSESPSTLVGDLIELLLTLEGNSIFSSRLLS